MCKHCSSLIICIIHVSYNKLSKLFSIDFAVRYLLKNIFKVSNFNVFTFEI